MILNRPGRLFSISSLQNILPILTNKVFIRNHSIHNLTSPNTYFLHLLSFCKKKDLLPLTSLFIVHNLFRSKIITTKFIKHCFHLGTPELALSTFKIVKKPDLLLQNLMCRSLCDYGLFDSVLYIYQTCRILGCGADKFTFPFVIKACSALGDVCGGKEIHCVVLRTGFGDNVVVQTALVDFYAKSGQMGTACLVFDEISQPDLVSWNALVSGFSLNGFDHEVFEVFNEIFVMGLRPNVSTLASIIPVCSRLGTIDTGKALHGFACKSVYGMDEYLIPAFISMYASGGDLSVARNLFDCVQEKNVTIWNAMLSAYTRNQKVDDAFELFREMFQDDSLQPNMVSFVSIIPSCGSSDTIWYGESLHAYVIKYELENQLSMATALLSMYANLGDLNSAELLFDHMPHRSLLSWNSMVSAYVQNGVWHAGLAAFREMQFAGFDPDEISIVSILSACSGLGDILLGKSAHAFTIRKGIDFHLNVSNALLAFYSDCHKPTYAFKLFHQMGIKDVVSWNSLISGCAQNGETKQAVILLHQMQQEGVDFDLVTLISILPCFIEDHNIFQGMTVHGYAIKAGDASDSTFVNALISMYMNCGELNSGKSLFDNMPNKSVVSWNALITGYRYHNLQNQVIDFFGQMIKEDQQPNHVTLLNVLPVCYTHLQGKSIHAYAARIGIQLITPLLTSLILMYARFQNTNSCLLLFQMGDKRNITLWNAIISAQVDLYNAKMAFSFFCELLHMDMKPDIITILSLISACVQLNNLNLTNCIMAYVICKGFDLDVAICNTLIDLYARCGDILFARKLFEGLLQKDSVSWSVMINGYGLHGDGKAALALLSQMVCLSLKPDDVTYLVILSACSHSGLVSQGQMVFNSMVEYGIWPRMEHYSCMVDLLSRTGHLNEAYDIVKGLPMKPSANLFESLLGACLIHGNVELGQEIGKLLLEVDPENSRPYVILYNIYAAAGRWTEANRVRSNMDKKQLRKVPGLSLVEGNQ